MFEGNHPVCARMLCYVMLAYVFVLISFLKTRCAPLVTGRDNAPSTRQTNRTATRQFPRHRARLGMDGDNVNVLFGYVYIIYFGFRRAKCQWRGGRGRQKIPIEIQLGKRKMFAGTYGFGGRIFRTVMTRHE